MTPNSYSLSDASNWKEAVSSVWRKQKTILILTLVTLVTVVLAASIGLYLEDLWNDFYYPHETLDQYYSIVLFLVFAIYGLAIAIYVMNWVLFASIRKWRDIAPESLKKSINMTSIGLMIILISAIVSGVTDDLSTVAGLAGFAGLIVMFVGIVQLRNAQDMPEIGRRGASKIMWGFIINWITSFVFILIIFASAISTMHVDDEFYYDDEDSYSTTSVFNSYDYYDDYDDYYDDMEYYDDDIFIYNHNAFRVAVIFALFVALIGWAISTYLTYRGWWLIGKSELPAAAEPEHCEEYHYEEVTTTTNSEGDRKE